MNDKDKQEIIIELTKVIALGLGVLAWHLLADKNSEEYRKSVMEQIKNAIIPHSL